MTRQVTNSTSTTGDVPAGPLSPEQWEQLQWATQHRALPAPGPTDQGPEGDAVPNEVDPHQEAPRDRSTGRPSATEQPPLLTRRQAIAAADRRSTRAARAARSSKTAESAKSTKAAKPTRVTRVGPATTVTQVVIMQLTVAAVGLTAPSGGRLLTAAIALGALITLLCFGLWRGSWVYQWLVHALRWSRRRTIARQYDRSNDLVPAIIPELLIAATKGPGDEELGVAYDGTGWAAAVAVTHRPDPSGRAVAPDQATGPVTLTDVIGALGSTTGAGGPTHPVQIVAHRTDDDPYALWLVTRVEPDDSPAGGILTNTRGVPALLRTRLRAIAIALSANGLTAHPLDPTELAEATSSTVIAIDDPDDPDAGPTEGPRCLSGPAGAETTVLLQAGQPAEAALSTALDTFLNTYRGPVTITTTLLPRIPRSTAPGAPTSALLRIARRHPSDLPAAVKDVAALLDHAVSTQPLTYRQGPALAASLPLGRPEL